MSQSAFEIDRQTLDDLAIFPNMAWDRSVLKLFGHTVTIGGNDKLLEFFNHPLTGCEQVEQRVAAIQFLANNDIDFNFNKGTCDFIEFYLNQRPKPVAVSKIKAIEKKAMYFFTGDNDFYIISRGVESTLHLLNVLDGFSRVSNFDDLPGLLQNFILTIRDTIEHPDFAIARKLFEKKKLSAIDIAGADYLFRYSGYGRIKILLDIVYQLDVFTAAGIACKTLGFSFPVVNKSGGQVLKFSGLFHPFVNNPVQNDIAFSSDKNICFVTGANMAGKSTFLKAVGIAVFLSQLGFPVPAAYMETSVFEGLITTINLADDIQSGNSHFYTEVSRVKYVAEKMAQSQNLLVIFDELFRGTNVKDAFDASLAIISAFSKLRKSFFIISTHIVEVANELHAIENINFRYMESSFDNGTPTYSYKLQDGITEERLGMWIVKNAGIVEIIEQIVSAQINSPERT
jgi:DNA mismatch repair ATPase MutS